MIDGLALAGPLLFGLLGSVHCVGMCGGIAGALALGAAQRNDRRNPLQALLVLGAGRIASYGTAGLMAGAVGLGVTGLLGSYGPALLRIVGGALLLGVAMAAGGISRIPLAFERLGTAVWRRLVSLAGHGTGDAFGGMRALAVGVLWGWIPCGLVYAALGWAATAGDPAQGALRMIAFGLGTLPSTLVTGVAAARLGGLVRARGSRRAAAVLFALCGLWMVAAGAAVVPWAGGTPACHQVGATGDH